MNNAKYLLYIQKWIFSDLYNKEGNDILITFCEYKQQLLFVTLKALLNTSCLALVYFIKNIYQ